MLTSWLQTPLRERESSRQATPTAAQSAPSDAAAAVKAPVGDVKGAESESPAEAAVESASGGDTAPKRKLDLSAAPADGGDGNAQPGGRVRRTAVRKAEARKAGARTGGDGEPKREHPELADLRRRVESLLEEARAPALHPGYASHASTEAQIQAAVAAHAPSALEWREGGPQLPKPYYAPLTCVVCESQEPLSTVAASATERFIAACAGDGAAAESARVVLLEAVKKAVPAVAQRRRWGLPAKLSRALGRAPGPNDDEDADEAGAAVWCWEPVSPTLLPKGCTAFYKARRAVRQRRSQLLSALGAWQQLLEKAPAQEVAAAEGEVQEGGATDADGHADAAVRGWREKAEKARARVRRSESELQAAEDKLAERVKAEEERSRRKEAQARVKALAKERQLEKEAQRVERERAKTEKSKPPQGVKPISAFFSAPPPAREARAAGDATDAAERGAVVRGSEGEGGAAAVEAVAHSASPPLRPAAPPVVGDPYAGSPPPLEEAAALWRRSRSALDTWARGRRMRRARRLLRGAVGPEVDVDSMLRAAFKAQPRAPSTEERAARRRAAAANPFASGGGGGVERGGDATPMVSGVPVHVLTRRRKLLQFHDNFRPPYFGTHGVRSTAVRGRRPFARDPTLDYEVDSDEEWEGEEEEEGESLSGEEGEEEGGDRDGLDYEDGFLCADNIVEYSQEAEGGAVTVALTHGAEAKPGQGKGAKHSPTALAKHAAVYGPFLGAGVPTAAARGEVGCDVAGTAAPCKELAGFRVHVLAPQPEPWTPDKPPAPLEGMWARVEEAGAREGPALTAAAPSTGAAAWQKALRLVVAPPTPAASRAVAGALCPAMEPAAGTLASALWLRSGRRRRAQPPSASGGSAAAGSAGMAPEALATLARLLHGQATGKERVVKALKEAHPGHSKRHVMRVVDEIAHKADPPKGAASRKKRWVVRSDILRESAPELLDATQAPAQQQQQQQPADADTASHGQGADEGAGAVEGGKGREGSGGDGASMGPGGDAGARKRKRIQPVLLQPSGGGSNGSHEGEEKKKEEGGSGAGSASAPPPKRRARIAPTLISAPASPPTSERGGAEGGDDMPASAHPHTAQSQAEAEGEDRSVPRGQKPLLAFFKQAAPAGPHASKSSRKRGAPTGAGSQSGRDTAAEDAADSGLLPPAKKHTSAGPAQGKVAAKDEVGAAEAKEDKGDGEAAVVGEEDEEDEEEEEHESLEEVVSGVVGFASKGEVGTAAALLRRTVLASSWPHASAVAFADPSLFSALLAMAGAQKAATTDRAAAFKAMAHALSLCTPAVAAKAEGSGEEGKERSPLRGARQALTLAPVATLASSRDALCSALRQAGHPQRTTLSRSALRAGAVTLEVLRTILEAAGGESELLKGADEGVAESYNALVALAEAAAATLCPLLPSTLQHSNLGIRSFAASVLESALRGPERVRAAVARSSDVAAAAVAQCCPMLVQLSVDAVAARAAAAAEAEEQRAKRSISRYFGGSGSGPCVRARGGEPHCSAAEDAGPGSEEARHALVETLSRLPRVAEGRVALRALAQVWRHMRGLLGAGDRAALHRVLCDRVIGTLAQEIGPEASALVAEARTEAPAREGASGGPSAASATGSEAGDSC